MIDCPLASLRKISQAAASAFLCLLSFSLIAFPALPLLADPDDSAPATDSASQATSGDTLLQVNDLVRITVFDEDDLLTETRIEKTGNITFPLIGPVQLAGKTVAEATEEIRSRLDKDYIIHPQVTLTILEYARQWVTVLGEVQKPGTVEVPPEGGLDLLGAIALAGGYTRIAAPNKITVRRNVDGHDEVIKVDGKRLAKDPSVQIFYIKPGDTIYIGQSIF
jgi:polysaccharide export outer membrane protein